MPPKTYSIEALRALGEKETKSQLNRHRRELENTRQFNAFADLVKYLQSHWDKNTIIVPLPPNFTNDYARSHHMEQSRIKKAYYERLSMLSAYCLMPAPPTEPPEMAEITATFYLRQLHDVDGLVARMKFPQDWLNRAGWMVDDSPKYLRWAKMPEQVLCGKTPPRIEITIKEHK